MSGPAADLLDARAPEVITAPMPLARVPCRRYFRVPVEGLQHGAQHAGVPVLLLRPMVGAMALWGSFVATLAERMRVIAFDPRGTGASSDAPVDASTRDLAPA